MDKVALEKELWDIHQAFVRRVQVDEKTCADLISRFEAIKLGVHYTGRLPKKSATSSKIRWDNIEDGKVLWRRVTTDQDGYRYVTDLSLVSTWVQRVGRFKNTLYVQKGRAILSISKIPPGFAPEGHYNGLLHDPPYQPPPWVMNVVHLISFILMIILFSRGP